MPHRFRAAGACVALGLLAASTAGAATPLWIGEWGPEGSMTGQLEGPRGICVDPAGTVYVADSENNRVVVYDTAGFARLAELPVQNPSGIFFTSRAARIGF